ncbi:MAG: hypothetical protein K8R06_09570 [Methanosarcinales archaeon]|nr:hypothetical protein [Methanosarcinales archaeon]MCD4810373.1 hypothetical protein [Methanosarcinales archaeon]MCD4815916.1 hypothetical protein [Methanosarcinales archaeon]MCD4816630.1 hypothetical protein [Methanosarcinales archaeon]
MFGQDGGVAEGDVLAGRFWEYAKRRRREFLSDCWMGRIGLELVRRMTNEEIDTVEDFQILIQ